MIMGASQGGVKYQYLAGLCVNIVTLSYGTFCGWQSASSLELEAEDSPLASGPMNEEEIGWMGGMFCAGGIFGTLFFAWYADKGGRKRCMLLMALPSLVGWLIIPFAQSPLHMYASRFIGGTTGGGCFAVVPLYIAELAEDSVRGILGTFMTLALTVGMLLGFVLGYYFSYITVAWISTLIPVLFLACFAFLPETPHHLVKQNKVKEAENALRYFRNILSRPSKELSEELQHELRKLRNVERTVEKCTDEDYSATWRDLCDPTLAKAFYIGLGLIILNNFCGCFVILNHTASIFEQSGSSMSPKLAAIVVGVIQIVGTYISTVLVERAGRKLLMLISTVGTGLGLAVMGIYNHLAFNGLDVKAFAWVPVASFSFLILLGCLGLMTLPFLIIAEIMPQKVRNLANMTLMTILWILSFIIMMALPFITETFGMHGLMYMFSASCFAGTIFVAVCLPETKGKSIESILASL